MARQICWFCWSAAAVEILGTGDQDRAYRTDPASDQAGVLQCADPDRGVEPLGDQIDLSVVEGNVDFKPGMAFSQLGEDRHDMPCAEGERGR